MDQQLIVMTGATMAELDDRLRTAHNSYNDEYNELCDTWKALDQKAQGSLQIAGVMIALLAGFATKTCEPLFGDRVIASPVIILSGLAFLFLWACVLSALLALWVQRVLTAVENGGAGRSKMVALGGVGLS